MSAWGLAGGGPMNAQQIETLIAYLQTIQIPTRGLPAGGGRATRTAASPATCRPSIQADIETRRPRSRRGRHVRHARRGAVQPRRSAAAPTAAPAATPRAGATAIPASPARAPSAGTSPAAPPTAQFPTRRGHGRLRRTPAPINGAGYGPQGAGQRPHARLRRAAHRRADRRPSSSTCGACDDAGRPSSPSAGSPSSAASSSSSSPSAVLCGSVYLILGTNLGARLGFLVALTGLFGWMFLMGIIWGIYGIGLKGPEPSWEAVPGRTVLQDTGSALPGRRARRAGRGPRGRHATPSEADLVDDAVRRRGLGAARPSRTRRSARPSAAAATFLEETGTFAAGEFQAVNVFDIGGERYPKIGDRFDFLAFCHEPHYAVVEVAAARCRRAPSRAGPRPPAVIDDDPPAPVRVHDPRPRRPPPAGVRADHRRRAHLLHAVLAAAPPRAHRCVANRSTSPVPARCSGSERAR